MSDSLGTFFCKNCQQDTTINDDYSAIYGFTLANYVIEAKENTKISILNN